MNEPRKMAPAEMVAAGRAAGFTPVVDNVSELLARIERIKAKQKQQRG